VGGEHLDRDAAGHSDDTLKNELGTFYFVAEDEDLAAAAGLLSEREEEAEASAPAPVAGAPAKSARGVAEPAGQAATNPMEVHGAAAEALGGGEEEKIAAGGLGAEEEEAEDAEDAEEEAEEEVKEEEEEDVPDVEETLDMSDAALASTRLGSIELTNTLGVRTTTSATILTHLINMDMSIPVDQLLIVGDDGSFQQFSKTDLDDMQARVLVARALEDPNVDCLDKQATFVVRNGRHITSTLHGEGAPLKAGLTRGHSVWDLAYSSFHFSRMLGSTLDARCRARSQGNPTLCTAAVSGSG